MKAMDYRPKIHFSAPNGWLNDPNGLVYFEGEYHLFYQHNPGDIIHGPMYWGHAVSRNLLHWEHLPIALYPDEHGVIFSGSSVVDWHDTTGFFNGSHGLVAIFTHHRADRIAGKCQSQSIAYSLDNGRTWEKYSGNPVIPGEVGKDFRDPKVFWHEQSNGWIMLLAVGDCVEFYGSPDLKEWQYLSRFTSGSTAGVWECPDLFLLKEENTQEEKWVLTIGVGKGAPAGGSGIQYFVGEFDGERFTADPRIDTEPLWLDYGKDYYAGQSWSDEPGDRRLWICWMNNWEYANSIPATDWRGAMTLPRELLLKKVEKQFFLYQQPVRELSEASVLIHRSKNVLASASSPITIDRLNSPLDIQLELKKQSNQKVLIRLLSAGADELSIGWNNGELYLDRTEAGKSDFAPGFPGRHIAPLELEKESLSMRILVDSCSVEVFAQDGFVSITDLVFPNQEYTQLEIASLTNEEVILGKLEINRIRG